MQKFGKDLNKEDEMTTVAETRVECMADPGAVLIVVDPEVEVTAESDEVTPEALHPEEEIG